MLGAGVGLAAAFPLLAVASVAIWREDGGPVLFRHARVGQNFVSFEMWKLRTMRQGERGGQITAAGDRRITGIGRSLRRFKLDELPQLWNVIRGDMSLVGPRPEAPDYVDASDPAWCELLRQRPGITDLATLLYRDEEALLANASDPEQYYRETILPQKLALSLAYARTRSIFTDIRLIAATIRCSFCRAGFDPATIRREFLASENS